MPGLKPGHDSDFPIESGQQGTSEVCDDDESLKKSARGVLNRRMFVENVVGCRLRDRRNRRQKPKGKKRKTK